MKRFGLIKRDLAPEEEILRNRYVMGGAACMAVTCLAYDPFILTCFVIYLTINAALHGMRLHQIWPQQWRCYAAIMLDVSMGFAVMMHSAEIMSFFYPLYLWVIVGNGFRFGVRFLVFASILSVLAFGTVVLTTPYWESNQILGYSLILALMAIPAYCSKLIKNLSQAKEAAEAASRAKSYFLASVSHELRTPLNAIIGYGNHLKQMDMPKKQHDMVEASVLAGEHLLHLIDQLIQLARSDSNSAAVVHQPMRLTELFTEIRDIMTVRAEDKSIALHITAAPLSDELVDGPADIIRNILLNLTGNAIKFTESGTVSINGGIESKDQAGEIWFTVTDTGIGIAADAIEKIFEPFQQADDTVLNRFGGTGLGLAICKQLVGQVGGTISVESTLGRGSCFTVRIPVKLLEQAEDTQNDGAPPSATQIIAIGQFDDALLERAQAAGSYSVRKVDCQSAADLQQALHGLDLAQFDIAMLDENLTAGLTPEDQLWQRFANAEVAPVLVSNQIAPDLGEVSLRAAFASVIPANASFNELRSAIRIGCSFAHRPRFEDESQDRDDAGTDVAACSVLVADDNRTNRNILAAILEAAGHRVTQVCDGDEVLEILEKESFDIVLLDVNMPRLNGIDACAMWRQIEGGRHHLPMIGVTADATSETEMRCLNAGMDLRLTKPINAKLLLSTINKLCGPESRSGANDVKSSDPLGKIVPISGHYSTVAASAVDTKHLDYLHSIGGESFVIEMVEGFLDDVAECRGTMQAAVEAGDVHQFRFGAHAFKSSSNNIGARTLAEICANLEKVTEAEFARDGKLHLSRVEAELTLAVADLEKLAPQVRVRRAS